MKSYKLNIEKSFEIHKKAKKYIEDGFCYNNCIEVLGHQYLNEFKSGKYNIGYCYMGGEDYYFQRHCVILTNENEIIDLSVPFECINEEEAIKKTSVIKYYVFKNLGFIEYVKFLNKTPLPAFVGLFRKEELEVYNLIKESGHDISVLEFEEYVKPLLQK